MQTASVLILARGGSKGIPLKNIQKVGGITLLARTILTAKRAGFFDITVSTDHPLIALEALKYETTILKRSYATSSDWAPSIWGVQEFIQSRPDVKILILLQTTSPFIKAEHLYSSFHKLNYPKPFDCVFSITRSHQLRWSYAIVGTIPLNFQYKSRPRRQDWNVKMSRDAEEVTFEELESTDVISVELVPERKGLILKHCEYYVSSRRYGTTVTRRYNEFVQLYDVLHAKYPYRAVCSLPPKRVVVGGGSPLFLQRRRAALQRWLTLVARHPVLAHDADLRMFLCESSPRLDKPKHDEFILAGTQEDNPNEMTTDEMQEAFASEQEELRLTHLGMGRLFKIFEKVESRCSSERADVRELGAALTALAARAPADSPRWARMRDSVAAAARLATETCDTPPEPAEDEAMELTLLALDALGAYRQLCARLTRGLHAERAAAAAAASAAPPCAATVALRSRHRYALRCAVEEARTARAYALSALQALPELPRARGAAHARAAALWADLHAALQHPHSKKINK
ncbi:unnamed protein product, partial [Brenthis ino]